MKFPMVFSSFNPTFFLFLLLMVCILERGEIEETGVGSFNPTFQVSVEKIEQLTQLRFGVLKDYDIYSDHR